MHSTSDLFVPSLCNLPDSIYRITYIVFKARVSQTVFSTVAFLQYGPLLGRDSLVNL